MINFSSNTTLTIGHYVFEASFWLRDWQVHVDIIKGAYRAPRGLGAINILHLGPFCLAITNLKKLKALYESRPERISLDELLDL
jgi:hypothetical protein